MEREGLAAIEPRREAQARFNAGLQKRLEGTVWDHGRLRELVPRRHRAQHDAVAVASRSASREAADDVRRSAATSKVPA